MCCFKRIRVISSFILILLAGGLFFTTTTKTEAETLASTSATVTTSRSSPSTPLAADQAASATQITIYDNNSIFLSSDSAKILADTGETLNVNLNVSSMSATGVPSAGQRQVYFTNTVTNTHHSGDPVIVPITAMHTIQFTTVAAIPANGRVVITFPGSANNTASPSASTFAFNGLNASGGVGSNLKTNGITCNANSSIASPLITCYTTAGVAAGTTVTFLIGCSAASGAVCTTQVPTLINPTKTAANSPNDIADTWTVTMQTQDTDANANAVIDSSKAKIATLQSVQVIAQVDPTLSFTILPVTNGTNMNTVATGCASQTTNSGTDSTSTVVDMGVLNQNVINLAAQELRVSTNGQNGYAITATASGQLRNPSSGYSILSSTAVTTMTAGTEYFGIQPCGPDAPSEYVPGTALGSGGKVAWPTTTVLIPIAYWTSTANARDTGVVYAGTTSGTTPEGQYQAVITYVATPSF